MTLQRFTNHNIFHKYQRLHLFVLFKRTNLCDTHDFTITEYNSRGTITTLSWNEICLCDALYSISASLIMLRYLPIANELSLYNLPPVQNGVTIVHPSSIKYHRFDSKNVLKIFFKGIIYPFFNSDTVRPYHTNCVQEFQILTPCGHGRTTVGSVSSKIL